MLSSAVLIVVGILLALAAVFFYMHDHHGSFPGAPVINISIPAPKVPSSGGP
ncbi:MAG: hypothetical protein HY053_01010 [Proteobacteria bacterium]|nr:hypothetical protein [Pseudomonadota bacterium]